MSYFSIDRSDSLKTCCEKNTKCETKFSLFLIVVNKFNLNKNFITGIVSMSTFTYLIFCVAFIATSTFGLDVCTESCVQGNYCFVSFLF